MFVRSILAPILLIVALPAAAMPQIDGWSAPAFVDLELDLSAPPSFRARARATFAGVTTRRIPFLLNRDLAVTSARTPDGVELPCKQTLSLHRQHHPEGRTWLVDLGRTPDAAGERVTVELTVSGQGADGSAASDWRGILLLASDEFRMSEQTIFYPQVPLSFDGPAKAGSPARVEVIVPARFEVFVAGTPIEPRVTAPAGARTWAFAIDDAGTLDVVAGEYVRDERTIDGLRLVSLLRAEHGGEARAWLEEAAGVVRFYTGRFGSHRATALAVVEMRCRKGSYNWAARGLLMFDTKVFGGAVPKEKVGHEVAHLWWGQTVRATGAAERFLTEGLAEYSSWRYVEATEGRAAAMAMAREARDAYLDTVHRTRTDPGLARVGFSTPGYSDLAYNKGALVLRHAEQVLGRDAFDAGLARFVERHRGGTAGLDDFLGAVFGRAAAGHAQLPWIHGDGHAHVELEPRASDSVAWRFVDCPAGLRACTPEAIDWRALPGGSGGSVRAADGRLEVALKDDVAAVCLDPEASLPIAGPLVHALRTAALVSSDPSDGAEAIPFLRSAITLRFDRPLALLDRGAADDLCRRIRERATADVWVPHVVDPQVAGAELTLRLQNPLTPRGRYALHVDGLADGDGVPVAPVTLRFITGPSDDVDQPRIVATEPASGAVDVPIDLREIRIRFSEPMRSGSGYSTSLLRTLEAKGLRFPGRSLGESQWLEGGTVLVHSLRAALEPGVTYVMPLRAAFLDLAANPLVDFDLTFTTAK